MQPSYALYSLFKRAAFEQAREEVLKAAITHALFRYSMQWIDTKL